MLACGYQPITAFAALYQGALGGGRQVTETFVKTCPLLLTGLAVGFAFRCGVWNIGAEGQYLIGTLTTTWIGTSIAKLPPIFFIPLILIAGFISGGIWAAIAGLLKAYRGVQEVITTIMLNFIALEIVRYSVDGGPLQEATKSYQQSERIAANALLPHILPQAWIPHKPIPSGPPPCVYCCPVFVLHPVSYGTRLSNPGGWAKSDCRKNSGNSRF